MMTFAYVVLDSSIHEDVAFQLSHINENRALMKDSLRVHSTLHRLPVYLDGIYPLTCAPDSFWMKMCSGIYVDSVMYVFRCNECCHYIKVMGPDTIYFRPVVQ
jgi:hypothetical protein